MNTTGHQNGKTQNPNWLNSKSASPFFNDQALTSTNQIPLIEHFFNLVHFRDVFGCYIIIPLIEYNT
jgi:hypothetical protein